MADSPQGPDATTDNPTVGRTPESPPGTPRWVKVFGIIAVILVLLISFALFTGLGGPHGPARHGASSNADSHTPRSSGHAASLIAIS